jgi:hypothetical protein
MIIEIPHSLYDAWQFEVNFDEGETGIDIVDCGVAWIANHSPDVLNTPEPVYLQVAQTDILIPVKE